MPPNVSQVIPEIVVALTKPATEAPDVFEKLLTDELNVAESETQAVEGDVTVTPDLTEEVDAETLQRQREILALASLAPAIVQLDGTLLPTEAPGEASSGDESPTDGAPPPVLDAFTQLPGVDHWSRAERPSEADAPPTSTNALAETGDESEFGALLGAPPPAVETPGSQPAATEAAQEAPSAANRTGIGTPTTEGTAALPDAQSESAKPASGAPLETELSPLKPPTPNGVSARELHGASPGELSDSRGAAIEVPREGTSAGQAFDLATPHLEGAPGGVAKADAQRLQPAAGFQSAEATYPDEALDEEPTPGPAANVPPGVATMPHGEQAPATVVSGVDTSAEFTLSPGLSGAEVRSTSLPQIDTAANLPEPLHPVVSAMRYMARNGDTVIRLQLQPERLGRVSVQVAQQADGLQIQLVADAPTTAGLLRSHVTELENALASAGVNVGQLSVAVGHGQAQAGQNGPPQPLAWETPTAEAESSEPDAISSGSSIRKSDALVDLRI